MCGIVGVCGQQASVIEAVLSGLEVLEYRGYDSWGVAGLTADSALFVEKQVGNVRQRAHQSWPSSRIAIGHTRWATHGGVSQLNAHPHLDTARRFAVVHNGVIENWKELAQTLPKETRYLSTTDTEVIAHLLAQFDEKTSLSERLQTVGKLLRGQNAFIVLDTALQSLGVACFGSPLLLGNSTASLWVVSDPLAFGSEVQTYYPLESGQVAVTGTDGWQIGGKKMIHTISWKPIALTAQPRISSTPGSMMLNELMEAPEVFTLSNQVDVRDVTRIIQKTSSVWLTGSGTAYHAALTGAYWLRKAGIMAQAFPASERDSWMSVMKKNDVCVLISQSGETRDTLLVFQAVKEKGLLTIALVNRELSTLARTVERYVITPAGPEQAVLATKSLIAQLILLRRIAFPQSDEIIQQSNTLQTWFSKASYETYVRKVAQLLSASAWTAVLGEGSGWMMALEAALKLKEGAYLPAEGMTGGELKHGTLALVGLGTPCLVLDVDQETHTSLIQHAIEVRARGGVVIGISPTHQDMFDRWIPIPEMDTMTLIPGLVITQLLTYHVAMLRGINPDRPRNLAKSVTVV